MYDLVLCWCQTISSDAMTRNAWEHSPGPILLVVSPHREFPAWTGASVVAGLGLVVLIVIARCTSETTTWEL